MSLRLDDWAAEAATALDRDLVGLVASTSTDGQLLLICGKCARIPAADAWSALASPRVPGSTYTVPCTLGVELAVRRLHGISYPRDVYDRWTP